LNVASSYYDLLKAKKALEIARANVERLTKQLRARVEYAANNYKAVSKQFEYGLANSIDVMDANTLLVNTERELANAQYDYQLAVLKVRRSTETLLT